MIDRFYLFWRQCSKIVGFLMSIFPILSVWCDKTVVIVVVVFKVPIEFHTIAYIYIYILIVIL